MATIKKYIIIDPLDNVATAIADLRAGENLSTEVGEIILKYDIQFGHKFALQDIFEGEYIIKYGVEIGKATIHIPKGNHVHVHNVFDIVDEVRKNGVIK